LAEAALQNAIALLALAVALVTLQMTITDRREAQERQELATSMTSEVIANQAAFIEYTDRNESPFNPPYLMLPIRLFVMNGSSLPQSIMGLWVTFDQETGFVTLDRVTESGGGKLKWPKVIPPRESTALDVVIPIPVDPSVAQQLGADPKLHRKVDLGPAGRLVFTLDQRAGKSLFEKMRKRVHIEVRFLSYSRGALPHIPYDVTLPE
jgi:hypothetical protein